MTILPHGTERIALLAGLSEADCARVTALAKSLRARYVPASDGYAMSVRTMGRFEVLYNAGYHCAYRNGFWRYGMDGGTLTLDCYEATKRARGRLQATT